MLAMQVATWNVLHWVHAQNHSEDLPAFAEEERAQAVVARIAEIDADVTCLQEVSGDTLELITARFGSSRVHSFRLPRVPPLKAGSSVLRDSSENLVIITAGVKVHAQAYGDDDGKGFIAVRGPGDSLVVNTHVSWNTDQGRLQLQYLDEWMSGQPRPVILCGDFNRDAMQTLQSLRPGWRVAVVRSDLKISRPKSREFIDHVLTRSVSSHAFAIIEDSEGISDHNIVIATTE